MKAPDLSLGEKWLCSHQDTTFMYYMYLNLDAPITYKHVKQEGPFYVCEGSRNEKTNMNVL